MSIDTAIAGNPHSVRASGDWLRSLPGGIHTVADALLFGRATAEAAWVGEGGDAFATHSIGVVRATDGLGGDLDTLGIAFDELAEGLTRAAQIMDDARGIAATANLLSGFLIVEVGRPVQSADPVVGPAGDMTAAVRTYDAFINAAGTVEYAREVEKRAHDQFNDAVSAVMGSLDRNFSGLVWLGLGAAATHVNTASVQSAKWTGVASARAAQLKLFTAIASEPHDGIAASATAAARAFTPAAKQAEAIAEDSKRMLGPLARMPSNGPVMTLLGGNVNEVLDAGAPRIGIPAGRFSLGAAGKIPFVGVAVTAGQSGYEIADGADPGRTVVVNGSGLVATTIVGGVLVTAGAPVLVIVIGLGLLGAAVTWGVGEVYDEIVDE